MLISSRSSSKVCHLLPVPCLKTPIHHQRSRLHQCCPTSSHGSSILWSALSSEMLLPHLRESSGQGWSPQAINRHPVSTASTTGGCMHCAHLTGSWKAKRLNWRSWRNRSEIGDGRSRLLSMPRFVFASAWRHPTIMKVKMMENHQMNHHQLIW